MLPGLRHAPLSGAPQSLENALSHARSRGHAHCCHRHATRPGRKEQSRCAPCPVGIRRTSAYRPARVWRSRMVCSREREHRVVWARDGLSLELDRGSRLTVGERPKQQRGEHLVRAEEIHERRLRTDSKRDYSPHAPHAVSRQRHGGGWRSKAPTPRKWRRPARTWGWCERWLPVEPPPPSARCSQGLHG